MTITYTLSHFTFLKHMKERGLPLQIVQAGMHMAFQLQWAGNAL